MLAALLVAGAPVLGAAGLERLVGLLGVAGLLLVSAALAAGMIGLLPWGVASLGGEYVAWLLVRGGEVDDRAPLYAGGLLLVAELGYWSLEHRGVAVSETPLTVRRLLTVALAVSCSVVLGAALLGASAVELGGGVVLELAGVLGALGVLALVTRLVWRERREP
ncbi:MAG: hypothetical protein H0V84_12865 [Actinobacteria bacterium]|nr:hypothetical protein [Actinomycetota bacterium]